MIYVNNLKTDSEDDIPSFPSPKPTISYVDDLDFFKDFENELPTIVYNDAQISKSDYLTEQTLSPQHNKESDLKDEISLSEYDDEEQNVLYFNGLFPFNVIHPNDIKSDEDNGNNEIDIIQSSEDMALPPREQRHRFLRFNGLQYTYADIEDFESRLARIYQRESIGMIRELVYSLAELGGGYLILEARWRRMSWREFILALGLYTAEEMQTVGFGAYWADSARQIPDKGDLRDYWIGISSAGDFLDTAPSYTMIQDPILRLCHRLIGRSQATEKVTVTDLFYLRGMDVGSVNVPYLLARYLRLFVAGRKSGAHIYGGKFVARLAEHFGLLTAEILGGLTVIALELPIIDMVELVRLQIYEQLDDTWAWVAMRLERQLDAAASAPVVAEDAPADDEGDQAILAPVHAPQQLPPPPPAARTMPQRLGRLEEEVQGLRRDVRSLRIQWDFLRELTYSIPETHQPGSKFSTIVHEYDTEPRRIFTLNARMGKRDDFKCVEAEDKSNLKTLL
ncbi:hypothetical protein Tco_1524577 [Tanacetum coccineum]